MISIALIGEAKGNTCQYTCEEFLVNTNCINGLAEWDCNSEPLYTTPHTIETQRLYVFPNITIKCKGALTRLKVAGEKIGDRKWEPKIQIWRMSANIAGKYALQYSIRLGNQRNAYSAEASSCYRVLKGDTIGVHVKLLGSFLIKI